jgi:large subunit ribosomal protein L21
MIAPGGADCKANRSISVDPSGPIVFNPRPMSTAVVKKGSRQYRVSTGETVTVDYVAGAKEGDTVEFGDVLELSDGEKIQIGRPTVPGAKVTAKVLRHVRDDKVIAFKYKRRKDEEKRRGHRQKYTVVEITQIVG